MISDDQLEKLYFTCKKIGYSYNQEIGQDFPAWAVDTIIKRGYWVAPKFLLIDYFREKFGRIDSPTNNTRSILRGLKINEETLDNLQANEQHPSNNIDHNDLMELLKGKERIVRVLFDKYGLSKTEIAYVLGVSFPNVSYHLKKSISILKTIVRTDTSF